MKNLCNFRKGDYSMYNRFIKRLLDILVVLILLLPLVVICVFIAIIIRIDSRGSVLFKQSRLGKDGKVFKILKFRTMVENAESIGSGLSTFEGDPRVTRVGNLLRKTSLDELPQLFNVLKGDMSIVGPRPPVPYHPRKYEEYPDHQVQRFEVRPGITGYAQVKGRNSLKWDERIEYDVEYVKNQSFLLDLKIVFLTIIKVFKKEDIHGPERRKKQAK